MAGTKKVGKAGQFGARYGIYIRRRFLKVEEKKSDICPYCKKPQLTRPSSGIFVCKKCGVKFAGGTYCPSTTKAEV